MKYMDARPIAQVYKIKVEGGIARFIPEKDYNYLLNAALLDLDELQKALEAALEWIDAVPKDIVLPAMPGFDRDHVEGLLK